MPNYLMTNYKFGFGRLVAATFRLRLSAPSHLDGGGSGEGDMIILCHPPFYFPPIKGGKFRLY